MFELQSFTCNIKLFLCITFPFFISSYHHQINKRITQKPRERSSDILEFEYLRKKRNQNFPKIYVASGWDRVRFREPGKRLKKEIGNEPVDQSLKMIQQ